MNHSFTRLEWLIVFSFLFVGCNRVHEYKLVATSKTENLKLKTDHQGKSMFSKNLLNDNAQKLNSQVGLDNGSVQKTNSTSESDVRMDLKPSTTLSHFGGPIFVSLTIENISGQDLVCDLYPPIPPGFSVSLATPSRTIQIQNVSELSPGKNIPTTIVRGDSYTTRVYLNRFLNVMAPGNAEIEVSIQVTIWDRAESGVGEPGTARIFDHSQVVRIQVENVEDGVLKSEFERLSSDLQSPNRVRRLECIEALCHVSSPLVIPFLDHVIKVPEGAIPAIPALSRFESIEAEKLLVSMLGQPNSLVVDAAIDALISRGYTIKDDAFRAMLNSNIAAIRFTGLKHLITERTIRKGLIEYVRQLTDDQNQQVAELAKQYTR